MKRTTGANAHQPARERVAGTRVRWHGARLADTAAANDQIRAVIEQRLEDGAQIGRIVAAIRIHEENDVVVSGTTQRRDTCEACRAIAFAGLAHDARAGGRRNDGRRIRASVVHDDDVRKTFRVQSPENVADSRLFIQCRHDNVHGAAGRAYISGMLRIRPLVLALGAELGALCGMAAFPDLRNHILAFVMLFALAVLAFGRAWLAAQHGSLKVSHIAVVAVLLRVPMFFTTPSLSDDVWRYLHDGRAQRAGISPYAYAPADPATSSFRGPEHARINHPDLVTIYPPAAQSAFLLNALLGSRLLWWRLILLASEVILIVALGALIRARGHPLTNLVVYAWHPLAVIESIGSAHLEPIGIALMITALLAATRGRQVGAGTLTGLSVCVKFVTAPLLLICTTLRSARTILAAAAVVIVAYALYWNAGSVLGSLGTFAVRWQANAGLYALLTLVLDGYRARIVVATLLVCALVVINRTRAPDEDRAGMFMFALLLLSPVVHAWYLLWLLAFAPLFAADLGWLRNAALVWSVTIVLSYAGESRFITLIEYAPVYGALAYGFNVQKKRRSVLSAPPLARPAGLA